MSAHDGHTNCLCHARIEYGIEHYVPGIVSGPARRVWVANFRSVAEADDYIAQRIDREHGPVVMQRLSLPHELASQYTGPASDWTVTPR